MQLGTARNVVIPEAERRRTAYHEAGHALLGMLQPGADPVRKVSIVPRGRALGVTLSTPDADRYGYDANYLRGRIIGALGGMAAEQEVFDVVTTGAESDLETVTRIARSMVGRWGMSERIGTLSVLPAEGDPRMAGVSDGAARRRRRGGPPHHRRVLRRGAPAAPGEPRQARRHRRAAARAREPGRGRGLRGRGHRPPARATARDAAHECGGPRVMSDLADTTLQLSSGARIPQVGLGVWQTPSGATTRQAVAAALDLGYRHAPTPPTSTATRPRCRRGDPGEGRRAREAVFVTTKLWNADQGYDRALRAFDASLERLGLDYIDLYLIHWPVAGKRLDSWRALERLFAEGRARSIGVSSFSVPHLEELLGKATRVPAVNQIELTPFLQRRETRALCAQHGITVEAYSPLTHGQRLDHPVVKDVARRVGRSVAQVLLRWGLQQGRRCSRSRRSAPASPRTARCSTSRWTTAP